MNIPLVKQSAELLCNINFPMWQLMLDNFLIDVKRNVILENSIDGLCKTMKSQREWKQKGDLYTYKE